MPSPDITPYKDFTIYDKDPQDVFDAAVLDLQTKLPNWVPREGNTEVLLLEAMGLEVAEAIFAINRIPTGVVEVLLKLFGIERDNGLAPIVNLKFNMSGTLGYTIPVGVQARLTLPGGIEPVVFTTLTELVINPGNLFGVVSAVGDRFTDDANNVVTGTVLELLDALIYVDTVTLDAVTTTGRDTELQADYFTRALTRFSRLSDTLVLPGHFVAYALENPSFYRAFAIDNWNGTTGVPGDHPGHISVAVYGNGAFATAPQKTALEAAMEAISLANLDVHVIDPTITTVAVTATVRAKSGHNSVTVQAAVQAALNGYLDPMTWSWSGTVRLYELISLMDQVVGVDYVETLAAPVADVVLSGNAPLADAGVLTITVNGA